jgi:hypothetical protein
MRTTSGARQNISGKRGRALREKRRRLRQAPFGQRRYRGILARSRGLEAEERFGRTSGEGSERVAQLRAGPGFSTKVDKPALFINVLKRMKQRRLPAREERDGDQDPR